MSDWSGKPEQWGRGQYRDVPICEWARLARERHVRDLKRAASGDSEFPYYYDDEAADRVVAFLAHLRHVEGKWAGESFVPADWQEWDVLRPLFGWKRRDDGKRRFRKACVFIPKKNGKTALGAAIGNYMFLGDREYGGRVFSAATKEDQALEVWNTARRQLQLSPKLRGEVQFFKRSLYNEPFGSTFLPLGRDSQANEGPSVHCAIVDEIHAHKNSDMIDMLAMSLGAREQPLILLISTYGFGSKSPIVSESQYCERILKGIISNEEFFCYLTTVDRKDDWQNPEEWQKANPNLGISIFVEGFEADYRAVKDFPSKQNSFKCKRLNIQAEQVSRWIPMDAWAACDGEIDVSKLAGRRAFGGLDLGLTRDLSSFVLAIQGSVERGEFLDVDGQQLPLVYLLSFHWVPEEGIVERWKTDGVNYPSWRDEGWIRTTPGRTTRNDIIRRDINELATRFEIAEIAIDRAHASELMQNLADDGFEIVKHAQTLLAMNGPCRTLEELVLQGRLRHGNDPVMRWMASNVAILSDGNGNMKIMKDKSGDRVDGMVAAVMALGRLVIAPAPENFVYNVRGIYVA